MNKCVFVWKVWQPFKKPLCWVCPRRRSFSLICFFPAQSPYNNVLLDAVLIMIFFFSADPPHLHCNIMPRLAKTFRTLHVPILAAQYLMTYLAKQWHDARCKRRLLCKHHHIAFFNTCCMSSHWKMSVPDFTQHH